MPRKVKEEAEKTRKRILASALALFTKQGYDRTTFTDIAARLKMTKGAVYWHFPTKEALLLALVDAALKKFQSDLTAALSTEDDLTYPAVAKMMIANALEIARDAKRADFFRFMRSQVKWAESSMTKVRENLINNESFGPKQAFLRALENDKRAGRIRADVNTDEVASVSIACWDGLVSAQIEKFLTCDLASTLAHTYEAIWRGVQAETAAKTI